MASEAHTGGLVVRPARTVELMPVLGLAAAFYREEGFTTAVRELQHNLGVLLDSADARVAVADIGATQMVGFAITTLSFGLEQGRIAELEDLYVRPAQRRGGIATALIDDSINWARSRGCRAVELVIAPNGNNVARLHRYYARHGFTDGDRRLLSRNLAPHCPPAERRMTAFE